MIITIAAAVLIVIALISYLWLMVEGFKQHVLWGIGIFFLPLVALLFAIMHWQPARKPFLIHIVSSVLLVGVLFQPVMQIAQKSQVYADQYQRGEITEQQLQARMQEIMVEALTGKPARTTISDDDLLTPEEREIQELRDQLAEKNKAARESQRYAEEQERKRQELIEKTPELRKVRVFKSITITEARNRVGEKFRVVSFEGVERQGVLLSAGFDRLILERHLAGGKFKFEILNKDIKVLEVEVMEMR